MKTPGTAPIRLLDCFGNSRSGSLHTRNYTRAHAIDRFAIAVARSCIRKTFLETNLLSGNFWLEKHTTHDFLARWSRIFYTKNTIFTAAGGFFVIRRSGSPLIKSQTVWRRGGFLNWNNSDTHFSVVLAPVWSLLANKTVLPTQRFSPWKYKQKTWLVEKKVLVFKSRDGAGEGHTELKLSFSRPYVFSTNSD